MEKENVNDLGFWLNLYVDGRISELMFLRMSRTIMKAREQVLKEELLQGYRSMALVGSRLEQLEQLKKAS